METASGLNVSNNFVEWAKCFKQFRYKIFNELYLFSGAALQGGCGGVEHPPTRQQIGKLLSQSAKLYWLKIPTEETTY